MRTDSAHRRTFVLVSQCRGCNSAPQHQQPSSGPAGGVIHGDDGDGNEACRGNEARHGTLKRSAPPVVIGGTVIDLQAEPTTSADVQRGGSVPGRVTQAFGGVGRNIAECLALLSPSSHQHEAAPPLFVTVVGADAAGRAVRAHWESLGLSCRGIIMRSDATTPTVCTVFDRSGEVAAQVADATAVERHLGPQVVAAFGREIGAAPLVVVDANLTPETMRAVCEAAAASRVPVWFEPVSVPKSVRAAQMISLIDFVSPNDRELVAMGNALRNQRGQAPLPAPQPPAEAGWREVMEGLRPFAEELLGADPPATSTAAASPRGTPGSSSGTCSGGGGGSCPGGARQGGGGGGGGKAGGAWGGGSSSRVGCKYVVLTLGALGAALCCRHPSTGGMACFHMQALPAKVVNCSGAGDCLVAGAAAALAAGLDPLDALAWGMASAWHAVQSSANVPSGLNRATVRQMAGRILETLQPLDG